jgi:hypothetical protein
MVTTIILGDGLEDNLSGWELAGTAAPLLGWRWNLHCSSLRISCSRHIL